ncbi:MAG: hypothetical protein IPK46_12700 [Saprospiraceae bacterium]|nr:hypothetical protein [Saprospiraceae bacterium]
MNVGETWTYTISYTATQADIDAGANLVNSARCYNYPGTGSNHRYGYHTCDTKSFINDSKDQTGGPNPITAAGQTINYTIVVTNTGKPNPDRSQRK